jgi:general secretion pathway protein L
VLLLCLVGSLTAFKLMEVVTLSSRVASLDTAIESAFRYTFPGIGEIRDPQALLQSKLRELGASRSGGTRNPFLDTLESVATAMSESTASEVEVQTINYRSGVMELRVRAPSVESLDAIQKAIVKDGGLSAEIQSANPEGDKVLGRLQIRGPGA